MAKRAEEPEEIDERASDRVLDRLLGKPPTDAERDWFLGKPRQKKPKT